MQIKLATNDIIKSQALYTDDYYEYDNYLKIVDSVNLIEEPKYLFDKYADKTDGEDDKKRKVCLDWILSYMFNNSITFKNS